MSRTFLQPIVKGANFDSFVGVEKAKRPTCRRPRRVRCNVINPYHLPQKAFKFLIF
jgi:predicted nucleotidyltransferase